MDSKSHSHRVFFGSLPPTCNNSEIKKMISPFVPVKSIKLIFDKVSGFCKGFGHVEFFSRQDQELVLNRKFTLEGRDLFTEPYFEGTRLKNKSESFHVRRIFISNIPQDVTDQELQKAFSIYGKVESAYRIVTSNQQKKPFGFILFHEEKAAIECNQKKTLQIKGVAVCCRFFKKREEINPQLNSTTQQQNLKNFEKSSISKHPLKSKEHIVLETPKSSNAISPLTQAIKKEARPNNKLLNDITKSNECTPTSHFNQVLSHRLRCSGKHEGYLIVTGDSKMAQIVEANHYPGNIAISKGQRALIRLSPTIPHVRNESAGYFSNVQSETIPNTQRPWLNFNNTEYGYQF